ncbi:hypothetical protein ASA1KI_11390 [Opitutales bacterium ASA1]|uniref:DUF6941 family protein n=1 Tax=Congregicoccus parvus TaxID=3081749 RepID=UPI002B2D66E7|nr:hypothetical protein ASA1KI_11390 [Opitutales bacterium ASA1]
MKVEVFALCDAAVDYGGKLSLLGAFDGIHALHTPVIHPQCAIALRVRVPRAEEGKHLIVLNFIDADGRNVMPSVNGNFEVHMPPDRDSVAVNLVLNIHQLRFERFGEYAVDLMVDGVQAASLPLIVVQHRAGPG